jgi:Ca2+-binding RTX toxin-like protein
MTALASACNFVQKTGMLTVPLNPGEAVFISRRTVDSALLVQGETCVDASGTAAVAATANNVKTIDVKPDAPSGIVVDLSNSSEIVVLDISNGTFAAATSQGCGTFVDLGGGGDEIDVIGSSRADRIGCTRASGKDGIGLRTATSADVKVAGHTDDKFVIDLAAGDDSFDKGNCVTQLDVYGGTGKDTLLAGTDTSVAGDHFHGGADLDTISYASRTAAIVAVADGSTASGDPNASEQDLIEQDIESIIGGKGNDRLVAASDTSVKHTLTGGDGDDTLVSAPGGTTTFAGGNGTDTVDYSARLHGITVTMGDSSANDGESADHDNVGSDIENLIASDFDDVIKGSSKANFITPGLGNDTVEGGDGDDTFIANDSNDGKDVYSGGKGQDTVDYSRRSQGICAVLDGVSPSGDCTFTIGQLAMTVTSTDADKLAADIESVIGTTSADHLIGNALGNVFVGLGGADWLEGKTGDDQLDANLYTSSGGNTCNPITFTCIGTVNGTCDCRQSTLSAACSQSSLLQCGGDPLDLAACDSADLSQFEGCWRTQ